MLALRILENFCHFISSASPLVEWVSLCELVLVIHFLTDFLDGVIDLYELVFLFIFALKYPACFILTFF